MSTILGILYKGERKISDAVFDHALDSLSYWNPDARYVWSNDNIMLGNLILSTTTQSISKSKSCFHTDSQCTIISDSRLDYKKELVQKMGDSWNVFKDYPDMFLILKSYLKWGKECVKYLYGDFAFAVWNDKKRELFCARDHFGIRPFYYSDQPDYFLISSDFMVLKNIPDFRYQIDEDFIVDSICTIIPEKHISAYNDINKLEPAHSLTIQSSGSFTRSKYWNLEVNEEYSSLDEKSAILGIKNRFIDSIENKMCLNVTMGIELSGGLDSSSIAACLSNLQVNSNNPIYAFTHTMAPEQKFRPKVDFDAYEFCHKVFNTNLLLKLKKISGSEQLGCFKAITDFLDINQKPIVQNFALMSDLLYEEAQKQGVRILFSGYGGDEGVTHNEVSYPAEFRKKWSTYEADISRRLDKKDGRYLWGKAKFFIRHYAPVVFKVKRYLFPSNKYSYKELHKIVAINKSLGRKRNIRSRYNEYISFSKKNNVRQRQYQRINFRHIPDRVENSYYAARKRRIEYRYPFLDVKLIEFYYSVKSEYKFRGGVKRYLFRMAMEGIVDDRIRLIPEKVGSAIPNIMQRLLEDEKLVRDIIIECKANNSNHYVDYNRLLWMIDQMKKTEFRKKGYIPPLVFFPAFSVLLLQKWQREGKIDIGIKC